MKTYTESHKRYYFKKIKPNRRNKGVAGQMKMRCFMCGHFIDYKKYMEKQPSITIDVKLWEFGGRANIIVKDFAEIKPEFREFVRKVLISKLKSMLRALNEPYERVEPSIVYSGYPVEAVKSVEVRRNTTKIPLIKSTEVKIW